MGKDITNTLTLYSKRNPDNVFRKNWVEDSEEGWEFSKDGVTRQIYATYISPEVARAIATLNKIFKKKYDLKSEEYSRRIARLIRDGRCEAYSGKEGYLVQLAQDSNSKIFGLVFHQVANSNSRTTENPIQKEVVLKKPVDTVYQASSAARAPQGPSAKKPFDPDEFFDKLTAEIRKNPDPRAADYSDLVKESQLVPTKSADDKPQILDIKRPKPKN